MNTSPPLSGLPGSRRISVLRKVQDTLSVCAEAVGFGLLLATLIFALYVLDDVLTGV